MSARKLIRPAATTAEEAAKCSGRNPDTAAYRYGRIQLTMPASLFWTVQDAVPV